MLCYAINCQRFFIARGSTRLLLIVLIVALLAACGGSDAGNDETPMPDVPGDDEVISEPQEATLQSSAGEMESRQVVIWAPDFWMPTDDTPAGQVLNSAITQFEQTNSDIKIEVQNKVETGESGILNYLRSAQRVAPAVLPDAVLLDTQDLWRIVELGMVQPLTDTVSLLPERFYPFAYSAVWIGDELYGIPYASDIIHSASFGSEEQKIPANWSELSEDGRRYLFPAAGADGGMSLLLQYIGVGGESIGDDLIIDNELMTRLFEFYASGVADRIFPAEVANLATMDAVWSSMNADGSDIVDTTSSYLLRQSESPDGILYAHTPTEEGRAVSVSRNWAFVILATDPGQRAEVLELVQLLLEPDVQGQWSQFANLLPSTSAAAATWNVNQPYYGFIISLLEGDTYAIPNGRPFAELLRRIQTAQQDVLSGRMTPEEAVMFVLPTP